MRSALALFALLSAACADTVLLGTECVTGGGACEQVKPAPGDGLDAGNAPEFIDGGEEPPSSSLDSGGDEQPPLEPPRDSGTRPIRDASFFPFRDAARPPPVPADAGPALFPAFSNPSFELVDGGREGPLDEANPNAQSFGETAIAPWFACLSAASVNSSTSYGLLGRMTTVTPTDGATFATAPFPIVALNISGITQELAQPLVPGQRYAFAIDVFAQPDPVMIRQLVLDVVESTGCVPMRPLASTGTIPAGSWQTKCIDFIAPEAVGLLSREVRGVMLMVNAPGDPVNFTALHLDNIRPVTPGLCSDAGTP